MGVVEEGVDNQVPLHRKTVDAAAPRRRLQRLMELARARGS